MTDYPILVPPYTPTVIDVTSDEDQEYILDLGTLPIRLSVEVDCSGAADTKLFGGNDPDGFVQLGATITSYPALVEFPTPTFRFFKVTVEPGAEEDILVVLNSKI